MWPGREADHSSLLMSRLRKWSYTITFTYTFMGCTSIRVPFSLHISCSDFYTINLMSERSLWLWRGRIFGFCEYSASALGIIAIRTYQILSCLSLKNNGPEEKVEAPFRVEWVKKEDRIYCLYKTLVLLLDVTCGYHTIEVALSVRQGTGRWADGNRCLSCISLLGLYELVHFRFSRGNFWQQVPLHTSGKCTW